MMNRDAKRKIKFPLTQNYLEYTKARLDKCKGDQSKHSCTVSGTL